MNADAIITRAFLHATRKPSAPLAGTTKYQALLGIVDSMQKLWASEPDVDWDSLYSRETVGTATLTDTFDLPDEVNYITKNESDPVLVGTTAYKLVRPSQLYKYKDSQVCAQVSQTLKFAKPFVTVGASITVPAILNIDDITTGTDDIVVDDPQWLVYAVAAEFDRNDIVKVAQYDNLIQLAEQHMQKMKDRNEGSYEEIDTPWQAAGMSWD